MVVVVVLLYGCSSVMSAVFYKHKHKPLRVNHTHSLLQNEELELVAEIIKPVFERQRIYLEN